MEYKILTPKDHKYPKKLKERLGSECPEKIYYYGPLEFLDNFTMAVISADSIGGVGLMAANQVLFTVREYAMNYIGSWHSVMEAETFRLGLYEKCNNTVTLFSAKGLVNESYESYLLDRYYPPLHHFPQRDEYFRRAKDGELLMLSVTDLNEKRQSRRNIMLRNWIACNLGDIVFVPFGVKGSKTWTMAKRIVKAGKVPIFTTDSEVNKDLHELGIIGYNRKSVRDFLEKQGAKLWTPEPVQYNSVDTQKILTEKVPHIKKERQLTFFENNKLKTWKTKS